jgi:Domain of unknown function (DUF6901)
MAGTIRISYTFTSRDGFSQTFDLRLNEQTLELISEPAEPPAWTELGFHQCSNCPLKASNSRHCPAATALVDLVKRCENLVSYDEIDVMVITDERTITQHTSAQRAISALMGLIMATSGCPHTAFLKPMARFHLPLASEEETVYRVTSMYLLAQYFLGLEGKADEDGFSGLGRIYEDLEFVNTAMAERLRAATETDSSLNAIVLLDLFAKTVPWVLNRSLSEIRHLFIPYLEPHAKLNLNSTYTE